MFKVQLGLLLNSNDALTSFSKEKLPIKLSYQLGKMLKSIADEMSRFEEMRQSKVKEFGVEDEKKNWQVPEDRMVDYLKDINELAKVEVEVYGDKLDIESLGDIKVESGLLAQLHWLFL